MIPYVILLTVPIMMNYYAKDTTINRVKMDKLPLFLFFLFLTVLVMFRHPSIGNDTKNYIYYFKRFAYTSYAQMGKHPLEVGFQYLCKSIALLSDDQQFFIATTGFLISAMLYPTYRGMCEDAPLTIVLFCVLPIFPMFFSGIRQMLAIGIGMASFAFTRRKRPVLFLLSVAAAMSFHASAFMLLFMYPLFHARITKKWAFFSIPTLAIVFVFNKQLFGLLGEVLQSYTRYEATLTSTGAYSMLVLFASLTVFCFVIPDEALLDDDTIGLRNFLLLSLVLQLFVPVNMLAMRMNYYYIIFIPLLLPRIIMRTQVRYRNICRWARNIMVVFFFLYFFFHAKPGGNLHSIPYRFFWEIDK